MKVLIVEDEDHVASRLSRRLSSLEPPITTVISRSRSSALEALRLEEFDFIICDLRLPPYDGGLDTDEAHGLAVHSEVKAITPGTPCLFFTGFATSSNVREQLSGGGRQDVFGTGDDYAMTRLLNKDEFVDCVERLDAFNNELAALDAITIKLLDASHSLDSLEERALRLVARRLGGTYIQASNLGGLSGAQTLRVSIQDPRDRTIASYFVKIGQRLKIDIEKKNYSQYVSPLLKMGGFPALDREIQGGIGKREALFYQLADQYTLSLFDILSHDEDVAVGIVENLRTVLAPWAEFAERRKYRIRELREQRVDKSLLLNHGLSPEQIKIFEKVESDITMSYQHGDLHGSNVLCDGADRTIVIDFANVGLAPACIDPLILELSVLFHSDSPFQNDPWPTIAQAERWFNLNDYLAGCPVPSFIEKCREWASSMGDESDLIPVVYGEALRQLKYPDTNHGLAVAIANAAMREARDL